VLEGKYGTGKSMFLGWFLNELLQENLPNKFLGRKDVKIVYICHDIARAYHLQSGKESEWIEATKGVLSCDTLLIDSVDTYMGDFRSPFRVSVTGCSEPLNHFRAKENSTMRMYNFGWEEAKAAFLSKDCDEDRKLNLQIKFDVFGGNSRLLVASPFSAIPMSCINVSHSNPEFERIIQVICDFFFCRKAIEANCFSWIKRRIYRIIQIFREERILGSSLLTRDEKVKVTYREGTNIAVSNKYHENYSSVFLGYLKMMINQENRQYSPQQILGKCLQTVH
jgi:hypothetical protein